MAAKENMSTHHSFKWGDDGPGHGVGTCRYCSTKIVFKAEGSRGGKVRRYKSSTSKQWGEKMPSCKPHAVTAVVATAAKSSTTRKKSSKKGGAKRTAAKRSGGKKGAKRAASKRSGGGRKKAAPAVSAPSQEAAATT